MAGVGFLGKILQHIKADKGGIITPVVKASIHANDNVNAEIYSPSGDDSPPLPDDMGFFTRNESTGGLVYLGVIDRANAPQAEPGERRLYARDDTGVIVATVWLKADGTLELLGVADNAVRFSALKTAFDTLKAEFNAHTHATAAVGPPSTPSNAPSAADIDPAKVDEVKLP